LGMALLLPYTSAVCCCLVCPCISMKWPDNNEWSSESWWDRKAIPTRTPSQAGRVKKSKKVEEGNEVGVRDQACCLQQRFSVYRCNFSVGSLAVDARRPWRLKDFICSRMGIGIWLWRIC
jgi:hypothetical protein